MGRILHWIRYKFSKAYRTVYDCNKLWTEVMVSSGSITVNK